MELTYERWHRAVFMALRGVHGVSPALGMHMRPVQQGEGLFVKATEHAQAPILCAWLSSQQLSSFLELGQMSDDESGEPLQLGKRTLDAIIEGAAAKLHLKSGLILSPAPQAKAMVSKKKREKEKKR